MLYCTLNGSEEYRIRQDETEFGFQNTNVRQDTAHFLAAGIYIPLFMLQEL